MKGEPTPGTITIEIPVEDTRDPMLHEFIEAALGSYFQRKVTLEDPIVINIMEDKKEHMQFIYTEEDE